ncbi:hypothetical protein BDU57DRAFT_524011 [Ampelomyces quisqualis]|uniref:HMG box domain-containing protein n=1 Tax=Ampelomyces quisqualis TaxID=50730 RepID=A0A6A5Q991_AMPQU|nr:hypothetical protein BDU57DRAFT_524011 [Ampelomyces quisqualis]
MLARSTLGRWAAAKTSARDLPQLARFVHGAILARNAADLPVARALSRAYTSALQSRRSYATTTAATRPTATVKKAVKAQAASKAAPKKKAAAPSKPANKSAKKAAVSRAKPRTRAAAKAKAKPKKAAPKKPAAKKRVKKVLTDEQKLKAKLAELRKIALKAPVTPNSVTALNVFIAEHTKASNEAGSPTSKLTAASLAYKALTPAEREHYNHVANERTVAKRAEYKAWIESHTPEQIRLANNARTQLRFKLSGLGKTGYSVHTARLVDERQPKRPANAYAIFVSERFATGDFKGIEIGPAGKIIGEEWKALSASEKKKYDDTFAAKFSEYKREKADKGIDKPASANV